MLVRVNRICKAVGRAWALASRPAIVAAACALVDFFEQIVAHIVDVHNTSIGKCKREGVAQSKRPHFFFRAGGVVEGVVSRYCAVRVYAQYFPEAGSELLRV